MDTVDEIGQFPKDTAGMPGRYVEAVLRAASCLCGSGQRLTEYQLDDWVSLVLWLCKTKSLIPLVYMGMQVPCDLASSIIEGKITGYQKCQARIIAMLCRFALRARQEKLHFVVVKGAPLAMRLYGSQWGRHYTDVDVLVGSDDVEKADYVARSCGFTQPAEFFAVRSTGILEESEKLAGTQAPFLIRHRTDIDHVSPYIIVDGQVSVALEVHDRLGGLDPSSMDPFLWGTRRVAIDDVEVDMPSDACTFAHLMMVAFEDSESRLANVSSGMLGFKLYCDLLACILEFDENEIESGCSLLGHLGREAEAGVVLSNMGDIFHEHVFPTSLKKVESDWGLSYGTRMADIVSRKGNAAQMIQDSMSGPGGCCLLDEGGEGLMSWNVPYGPSLECRVSTKGRFIDGTWHIPKQLVADSGCLVFQMRVYPSVEAGDVSEVRADMFLEGGACECYAKVSQDVSRGGKASRESEGMRCDARIEESDDGTGGLVIKIRVNTSELGLAEPSRARYSINGGVYKNHYGRLYHEMWRSNMTINGEPAVTVWKLQK